MPNLREALGFLRSRDIKSLWREAVGIIFEGFAYQFTFYHTERVVYWAEKVGRNLNRDIVRLSAWLHDVGYLEDPEGHRTVGAKEVERRLRELDIEEEVIRQIVDGIRNHGTKDRPETPYGHTIRLADALSVWDPQLIGFYVPVTPREELEAYRKMINKKKKVIEEYLEGLEKDMKEEIERAMRKTQEVLDNLV